MPVLLEWFYFKYAPLPAVISWQAFRISIGPPAWLQFAFFLILFFWSTTCQRREREGDRVILTATRAADTQQVILVMSLWNKFISIIFTILIYHYKRHLSVIFPLPLSASTHLCCRAVQGGRWSRLFAGGGTERSCSVSRQLPVEEDTGRLCSTPGSPASGDPLWCSGTWMEGTAAPSGWCRWWHTLLK